MDENMRPPPRPEQCCEGSLVTEYEDLPNTSALSHLAFCVGQVMSLRSAPTRSLAVCASPAPILLWVPDSGGHCYLCWDIDVATAIQESC